MQQGRYIRTDWVAAAKPEAQAEDFIQVDWIGVQDPNVHLPFFEVVCRDETDAWWEVLMDLSVDYQFKEE